MTIHKNTRLTPYQREEVWKDYCRNIRVSQLKIKYRVSRPTIYKILKQARIKVFRTKNSTNERFRCLEYWFKRLAKVEKKILEKKNKEAKRYNKEYPWEMLHMDTKKLPYIKWDTNKSKEYLFVWIDDYSRELYACVMDDKTQISSTEALNWFIDQCPYHIEKLMTDNWVEYKWTNQHQFVLYCEKQWIQQVFTKVRSPQTNGKAERVIRTIMEMRHNKYKFKTRKERIILLKRFVNRYNTAKPHKWINNKTPYEVIEEFYYWNWE